jgi:hypothetical protein
MGSLSGMMRQFGTLLLLLLVDILPNGLVASYTIAARRRDQQRRARGSSYYPSKFSFESTIVRSSVSSADVTSLDSRTSPTQSYSHSEPVIRKHFAKVKPAIWKHWLVPGWWDDARGVDETVVWDCQNSSGDTLNAAAERLLQLVLPSGSIVPSKVRCESMLRSPCSPFKSFASKTKSNMAPFPRAWWRVEGLWVPNAPFGTSIRFRVVGFKPWSVQDASGLPTRMQFNGTNSTSMAVTTTPITIMILKWKKHL